MAIVTPEQRKWYWREYEDLEFRGDYIDVVVSTDGPIPGYSADDEAPFPNLIVQVIRIAKATGIVVDDEHLTEEEVDRHYTDAEHDLIVKLIEELMDTEAEAYLAQRQGD